MIIYTGSNLASPTCHGTGCFFASSWGYAIKICLESFPISLEASWHWLILASIGALAYTRFWQFNTQQLLIFSSKINPSDPHPISKPELKTIGIRGAAGVSKYLYCTKINQKCNLGNGCGKSYSEKKFNKIWIFVWFYCTKSFIAEHYAASTPILTQKS